MSEWQDISTAPRDGTYLLLSSPDHETPVIGFWNRDNHWDDGDFNDHMDGITHWMPLPAPPPSGKG